MLEYAFLNSLFEQHIKSIGNVILIGDKSNYEMFNIAQLIIYHDA